MSDLDEMMSVAAAHNLYVDPMVMRAWTAENRVKVLRARVAELERALRPFADLGQIPRDGMQYVSQKRVDAARRLLGMEVEP